MPGPNAGKLAPSEKKLANSLDSAWKDITADHDVSLFYQQQCRRRRAFCFLHCSCPCLALSMVSGMAVLSACQWIP